MSSAVLALDLSSTATGIAHDGGTYTFKPKGTLHERARATAAEIRTTVAIAEPLVILEAIGTRHVQTAIAIATVHALVRRELADAGLTIIEVPPALLKRWATGKGNADKDAMLLSAVRAGWAASEEATNDEADAWWLWTIGEAICGRWHVSQTVNRAGIAAAIDEHRVPA